jgi:predicted acylesterase/phospholipase RssA
MAGAISAGAYTAGVVDYLLEALETWQERKDKNLPDTPIHQVEIPVIGGSSAGGMTGLLTASAIQQLLLPVQQVVGSLMDARPENLLYHSLVETYGKK